MARKLSLAQGRKEIKHWLEKYKGKERDKKVRGLIDNTLWAVAAKEGPEVANSLITQFELHRPAYGSHEWFDDDITRNKVIHLDPNFKVPEDWRIRPGDKRHPGEIKLGKGKKGR